MTDVLLPDGLYRVVTSYLCAGFIVQDGRVTTCAPVLRRKLSYWVTVAQRVEDGRAGIIPHPGDQTGHTSRRTSNHGHQVASSATPSGQPDD